MGINLVSFFGARAQTGNDSAFLFMMSAGARDGRAPRRPASGRLGSRVGGMLTLVNPCEPNPHNW